MIEGAAHQRAPTAIVKPGYAPIEQYADVDMAQGPWSDVYALAAVLHFAITGRKPAAAIDTALIVAPGERTQAMDAFRAALGLPMQARDATGTLVVSGSAPAGGPAGGAEAGAAAVREATRLDAARQRRRWTGALVAAAVVVVGAGIAWWATTLTGDPAQVVANGPAPTPGPAPEPAPAPAPPAPQAAPTLPSVAAPATAPAPAAPLPPTPAPAEPAPPAAALMSSTSSPASRPAAPRATPWAWPGSPGRGFASARATCCR